MPPKLTVIVGSLSGAALRDEGIARVLDNVDNTWRDGAKQLVLDLPLGWTGMWEDITKMIKTQIGLPHHPNAFGGISSWANKRKLIIKIGSDNMRLPRSHARATPVYKRVKLFE